MLHYRISATEPADGLIGVPWVEWLGESDLSAAQLDDEKKEEETPPPSPGPQLNCPATGGAYEYATLRNARGARLCVECGVVEGG